MALAIAFFCEYSRAHLSGCTCSVRVPPAEVLIGAVTHKDAVLEFFVQHAGGDKQLALGLELSRPPPLHLSH